MASVDAEDDTVSELEYVSAMDCIWKYIYLTDPHISLVASFVALLSLLGGREAGSLVLGDASPRSTRHRCRLP